MREIRTPYAASTLKLNIITLSWCSAMWQWEGDAAGADEEDDECLGSQRLDEPAGAEERCSAV